LRPEELNELVQYRLQEADEAVGDARYLLEGGRSLRGVVNRAYYAMFYAVLALLQVSGNVPSKHSGVLALFDRDFVLKGVFQKEHSKCLHRAFDLRQSVDYRVLKLPSKEETSLLVNQAAEFILAIKDHLRTNGFL